MKNLDFALLLYSAIRCEINFSLIETPGQYVRRQFDKHEYRLLHRAIPEYNMSRAGLCNCELASPWVNRLDSVEVSDDDWIAPRWSSARVPTRRILVLFTTRLRFLLAGLSNISCGYRPFSLHLSLSSLKKMMTLSRRCGVKIIVMWDNGREFYDYPLISVCLTIEVESPWMSSLHIAH